MLADAKMKPNVRRVALIGLFERRDEDRLACLYVDIDTRSRALRVVAVQLFLHCVIDWVLHKREESANSIRQSIYRAECLDADDFGVIIRNGSVPEL